MTDSAGHPRVALVSYSTKPRGGVVHTLSLAEALHRGGASVEVLSLGDPDRGFFRDVAAPYRLVPAPPGSATLEDRVFASIDALEVALGQLADEFDVIHTQDCISARAAARVRDAGAPVTVVRTVHHVDDFTTQALVDCQRQAILEPDTLVVVSRDWQSRLRTEYGRESAVIHNGVDAGRFGPIDSGRSHALRHEYGLDGRFTFLAVGGIEPRKGSTYLLEAFARLARRLSPRPALVVVGGHSFQDYRDYRTAALARLPELGLELGRDVVLAGTVTEAELHAWYRTADALAFPSVKEGWGLAVLEAMAADLPVVCSDIPVLREYLTDRVTALLTAVADPRSLEEGMATMAGDGALRDRLVRGGRGLVPQYSWARAAAAHQRLYAGLASTDAPRAELVGP